MLNTYTWTVPKTNSLFTSNVAGQTNVVTIVRYQVLATDGTHTATRGGQTQLTYVEGAPFTPFSNLTESQIVTWIQTSIGADQIERIQSQLDRDLNIIANPPTRPTTQTAPW